MSFKCAFYFFCTDLSGKGSPKTMIVPFLRYLNIFISRMIVSAKYEVRLSSRVGSHFEQYELGIFGNRNGSHIFFILLKNFPVILALNKKPLSFPPELHKRRNPFRFGYQLIPLYKSHRDFFYLTLFTSFVILNH